jgi:TonB family protein
MIKFNKHAGGFCLASAVMASLPGCVISRINPDATERANAAYERFEQTPGTSHSQYHDQLIRLWQDQPRYEKLIDAAPIKRVRMISAVAPSYPALLRIGHVNAKVVVSFVVGTDGRVEAARIVESSDGRFNDSVLEAIGKFTFIPAQDDNGSIRYMSLMPFGFYWDEKRHDFDHNAGQ